MEVDLLKTDENSMCLGVSGWIYRGKRLAARNPFKVHGGGKTRAEQE